MGEKFTVDCPGCDMPILVTPDMETHELYIYEVTCPNCGEGGYVVRIAK